MQVEVMDLIPIRIWHGKGAAFKENFPLSLDDIMAQKALGIN